MPILNSAQHRGRIEAHRLAADSPQRIGARGPRTGCEIAVHQAMALGVSGPRASDPLSDRTGPAPTL